MGVEIERKFLVCGDAWRSTNPVRYAQGYLNRDKHRTVRVRIAGERGVLTVKGLTTGASRAEFEYDVPLSDARAMLRLCDGPLVEKKRHLVEHLGMTWEVDEFLGDNAGLVVAEIELPDADYAFEMPEWVAEEVTLDARYFNSNLALNPFSSWGQS